MLKHKAQRFSFSPDRLIGAWTSVGLLALQACGGSNPGAEAADTTAAPPDPTSPPQVAPATPPTAEVAASADPPAPPPPESPLKPWARFTADLKLFPLGNSSALLAGPAAEGGFSFNFMLLSANGEITSPAGLNSQLPGWAELHTAAGDWPKSAFIGYVTGNGRVGWSEVAQATTKGWRSVDANSPRWIDVGVERWDKGRVLALSLDSFGFDRKPPAFRVVSGFPRQPVPKLAPSKVPLPKDGSPGCTSAQIPEGFAATELGHVFVVGSACGEDSKKALLEYFAPGKAASRTFELEPSAVGETHAIARADDDVVLSLNGTLMHFDGENLEKVADVERGAQLALTEQGTLWVNGGDKLYKQAKGAAWQAIPLPQGATASGLYVPDDDHVFVLAGETLYSLDAPSEVKEYKAEFGQKPSKISLPAAATPDCKQLYALLYGFTKVTPDDYDFPLTRKAIKGQKWLGDTRFVVTEDNGKKFFGAIPEDYETGKRLVAHVTKQVKGSIPVLLCANPKVVRELPIDLSTGEVKK